MKSEIHNKRKNAQTFLQVCNWMRGMFCSKIKLPLLVSKTNILIILFILYLILPILYNLQIHALNKKQALEQLFLTELYYNTQVQD